MTRNEIENTIKSFLVDEFEINAELLQNPQNRLKEDVGLDSLDFVDIVAIVEREFHFKPEPQEMKKATTLEAFYEYVEGHING